MSAHNPLTLHVAGGQEMTDYEIASAALARAVSVVEVKRVNDAAERLKFEARQAGDRELMANAIKLVMQARRRLGQMLIAGKEAGQIADGRPKKGDDKRIRLSEIGIDLKLSMESQKLARFDAREFETVLQAGRDKILAGRAVVINPLKDLGKREKAVRRAIKLAQLAAKQKALPAGKFGAILADPEWPDEDVWSAAGLDRAADNHYPTSSVADICARPVGDIAADDCVLGLWITARHLARGTHVKVLEAWGFSPRALLFWDKVEAGNGYWVRNRVEVLVIAVRGHVPAPVPGTQWEDLVVAPKTIHSRKPDFAHAWFEQFFPDLTKIELNARRARQGWAIWGNEAPEEDSAPRSGEDADRFGDPDWSDAPTDPAEPRDPIPDARPVQLLQPGEPAEPAGSTPLPGARQVSIQEEPLPGSSGGKGMMATDQRAGAPVGTGGSDDTISGNQSAPAPGSSSEGNGVTDGGKPVAQAAIPDAVAAEDLKGEPLSGEAAAPSASPANFPAPRSGQEADRSGAPLTTDEQNALIKAAYATVPFPGVPWIAAQTGLKPDAVKQRARYHRWSNPQHQRDAVRELARGLNARRKASRGSAEEVVP